jgi:hypothetical protein
MNEGALRRLLENPPRLHSGDFGIRPSLLRFIVDHVKSDSLTLETGGGVSTVCFAGISCEHTCIDPEIKVVERIKDYCRENQISTDKVRFMIEGSQNVLPFLDFGGRRLDFALIDGSHAFPVPVVDYYYINENLKVGGYIAVDDLFIRAVNILHRFLITDPAYELVTIDQAKTGVYRKIAETVYPENWVSQDFNRPYPELSHLPLPRRVFQKLISSFQLDISPSAKGVYEIVRKMRGKL